MKYKDEEPYAGQRIDEVINLLLKRVNDLRNKVADLENTISDMILTGAHEKELDAEHKEMFDMQAPK